MGDIKKCTKCSQEKSYIHFYSDKSKKSGLSSWCKSCVLKKQKIYQQENRDKIKQYRKRYNKENSEKISKSVKEYYIENKQDILAQCKEYRDKNKYKKRKRDRDYYRDNKKRIIKNVSEYHKKRIKEDDLYLFKHRIRTRISNSIKKGGYTKRSKTFEILGCDFDFFKEYIESQFKEGMTWNNIHLDHIKPMSSATTEQEVIDLNHYTNFQPLTPKANMSKNDKLITKQLKFL